MSNVLRNSGKEVHKIGDRLTCYDIPPVPTDGLENTHPGPRVQPKEANFYDLLQAADSVKRPHMFVVIPAPTYKKKAHKEDAHKDSLREGSSLQGRVSQHFSTHPD